METTFAAKSLRDKWLAARVRLEGPPGLAGYSTALWAASFDEQAGYVWVACRERSLRKGEWTQLLAPLERLVELGLNPDAVVALGLGTSGFASSADAATLYIDDIKVTEPLW